MPTVQCSAVINAPISEVFTAATDPNRGPEWNPNVQPSSSVPLPVAVGSRWEQTTIVLGRPMKLVCTVTKFEPPYYGELAISGEQQARSITRCEQEGQATRLTQVFEFRMPGGMVGRMMGGMVDGMLARELEHTMQRMKMTLELEQGGLDGPGTTG
jgi:uncharacterized protein YndB with AHSA1/START domain